MEWIYLNVSSNIHYHEKTDQNRIHTIQSEKEWNGNKRVREREKKLFHSTVVNDAYTSRRKEMQNAYSNNNNVR